MKPILKDNKLDVDLNKTEVAQLTKARDLGTLLAKLHQDEGLALVGAVDGVLKKFGGQGQGDGVK